MKTFKDLEFKPHPAGNGVMARMSFENGYGVSVIKYSHSYGSEHDYWEVGILYKNRLTYDTDITDDVLGWLSEESVTEVMAEVQEIC